MTALTLMPWRIAAGGGAGQAAAAAPAAPYLVACSGEGKGGALTVLRRSLVPEVITEVPLPGLLGAFAVHHRTTPAAAAAGSEAAAPLEAAAAGEQQQRYHHAYLLLSFPGATKVLATGEELREVTET